MSEIRDADPFFFFFQKISAEDNVNSFTGLIPKYYFPPSPSANQQCITEAISTEPESLPMEVDYCCLTSYE